MPETISDLKVGIQADTSQAEKSLDNLAKIVEGLKESVASLTTALKTLNGTEAANKQATDANTKAKRTAYQETMSEIRAMQQDANIANANARLKATLAREKKNLATATRVGAQTVVEATRTSKAKAQAELENARISRIQAQTEREASRASQIRSQTARDGAEAQRRLKDAIMGATNASKKNTSETKKNADEHKKAGTSAKHHANGLAKIAAALKRILIYRAIRGLIKSVGTAIKEGIQRMYEWSEANDQVFMKVMDTYATEVQYLKDALGAALAPLIETLMPVLVRLVDWFVELINKVQQFFRALAGYDDWLKVDKVTAKFAKDTDKAAKAQKALNTQLMDFDKLNLITTPKTSSKDEEETPPLTGHLEDIDPKIKKIAGEFRKIIDDLERLFGRFGQSGVFDSLEQFFTAPAVATWELIKSVFDFISNAKVGSGLSKLLDGITAFSVSGIENVTKIIKRMSDDGTFDALMGDVGNILKDVAKIADNVIDIILDITSIIGIEGKNGSGLWLIHYILGLINGLLEGIKEMLSGNIFGGLFQMIQSLVITPILGAIRLGSELVEKLDRMFHPNDATLDDKWTLWYARLDSIEGLVTKTTDSTKKNIGEIAIEYDEFGHEVIKDTDQMLRSSSSYWKKQAENAGTTYSKLVVFASTAYGRITDYTLDASLKAMQQNKTALQVRSENNKKLVANEKVTYDKIYGYADNAGKKISTSIGKSFIDIYGKTDKATKSINNKLKWLYKEGKISVTEYTAYQKDLLSKNDSVWKKAIDSISAKWKQFANSGRGIGEAFRKGFLDEIKKIENTQIAMNPGQQGQWNKAKVTIEKMAEGGYPSMGSMFVAGEVPGKAEFVGNINGRTGVASGEEITGIAEAVYGTGETEAMLLRQLIAAVRSQNLTISPSASLGKVVNQSQRLYAGVTG